jgi:alkanesulfonate monooxygenase SsuD/methylene tetrahydromethanopterin reductase-like flavin-dependent oxidoreductase (luciferase family)
MWMRSGGNAALALIGARLLRDGDTMRVARAQRRHQGRDPDEARRKADELNAAFDRTGPRREIREALGIGQNGFLSSAERSGNEKPILSE